MVSSQFSAKKIVCEKGWSVGAQPKIGEVYGPCTSSFSRTPFLPANRLPVKKGVLFVRAHSRTPFLPTNRIPVKKGVLELYLPTVTKLGESFLSFDLKLARREIWHEVV